MPTFAVSLGTVPRMHPILQGGVVHVVDVATDEQVVGSHTERMIACVADMQPVRYFAMGKYIANPVRQAQNIRSDLNLSVALRIDGACPIPASVKASRDLSPEAFGDGGRHIGVFHSSSISAVVGKSE